MPRFAHSLEAVQIRLKADSKEGHFSIESQTVFRQCLPSHRSGTPEICHMAFPANTLQAVQVRLKADSKEGHFTLEAETVFRLYLP
jgi:hypothetical protein